MQEAIETTVAWSAMATAKEEAAKEEASQSTESKWAKWRRGGIIGAAAITGGTLMAITGGVKTNNFSPRIIFSISSKDNAILLKWF